MKLLLYFWFACLALAPAAHAKQFEIFDGQFYNGLFYPLVDIIEWGEQDHELPHMEFHLHSKDKRVDLSVVAGDLGGRPVLWIMYDLKFRNEHICRHVLAPSHFREGMKLSVYRDDSDPDYDNVFVYSQPWTKKGKSVNEYTMPPYERCTDEQASNKPEGNSGTTPPPPPPAAPRGPASVAAPAPLPPREGKGVPVDYDNTAVPFSF